MPLPFLLKYIYNNGTDEVIRRGKRIFLTGGANLIRTDPLTKTAVFHVKNDTHSSSYEVLVNKYDDPDGVSVRCQCPYNMGEICRHEAAALFQLQDMFDKNILEEASVQYDQSHTMIKMKNIDLKTIRLLSSRENFPEAENIARHHQAAIQKAEDECVEATLTYEGKTYPLTIKRNEDRVFDTSCPCDETEHPLCTHKTALFLQLLNAYGPFYFDTIRNWDKEKNKLLEQYGYSLSDDLDGKFAFSYKNGKPFLRVLDRSIRKINQREDTPRESFSTQRENRYRNTNTFHQKPVAFQTRYYSNIPNESSKQAAAPKDNRPQTGRSRMGIVFSSSKQEFPYLEILLINGEVNEAENVYISNIQKIELSRYIDYFQYNYNDRELISPVRKLQAAELNKYLNRNSPFAGLWEHLYVEDEQNIPIETRRLILEYMHSRLKRLWPLLNKHKLIFWLPGGKILRTAHLKPVSLNEQKVKPEFNITKNEKEVTISCFIRVNDELIPINKNQSDSPLLFLHEGSLSMFNSVNDSLVIEPYLENATKQIPLEEWPSFLQKEILPLSKRYKVHFDQGLTKKEQNIKPQYAVKFREMNNMLLIFPVFQYGPYEVEWDEQEKIMSVQNGKILYIQRDKAAEESFIETIKRSHTNFSKPNNHPYFYLRAKEVLTQNWFLNFMDMLSEMKVPVKGLNELDKFRFNKNRPQTQMQLSSNMDWFDAKVEVQFGDQEVNIRDIKKALTKKQNFVTLADGTLGLLPEQWMEKYSLLFRMGQETEKGLRVSKYNFAVIDELYEHIDDEAVLQELEDKKNKLMQYDQLPQIAIPSNIKAVMRNYQESGLQWLSYLDEVKWGGILADDMGLGKTLQALSFLQHYKNENGKCLSLVVCPTTLIYNWENEISKFTPGLTYHIHHGPARTRKAEELKEYNIILTTYGTLRSDVQLMMRLTFDYVILDESQFIKNPHSKVTKAARLLHAHNRMCLSGTPMQNNTFDIYSQMNFLNPGMLGSIDFFKNEFAQPIDKFEDQERKAHLRKLIYPFILRRTKEQVARDLPDKSEMVLFCEMEPEQRSVYESYRNLYRSKILGTIDEQGIGRSQFTILQGLMKLRQICDSPAILKDDSYANRSVKLEELTREIQENTGNHKVLIFSQFLGMLGLIKEKLQKLNIPFEYFDGSTSAAEREKSIQNFQQNENCRVFLISLKAGGVGLNLTAADYVYIVDPWWNPAVEQQAIDRTHRIGQTKSIFAYRMICKNTIEEKILQLQEKKKTLVKDVISDESGFIKSLTKEDVMYLFS